MHGRILVMGGHEFDRLDGNEAIVNHIKKLIVARNSCVGKSSTSTRSGLSV